MATWCLTRIGWNRLRSQASRPTILPSSLLSEKTHRLVLMSTQIIGLTDWLKTPPGEYLLDWERGRFDQAVTDIFGYHALQLGLPEVNALRANRMPHQWLALDTAASAFAGLSAGPDAAAPVRQVALLTHSVALPFAAKASDPLHMRETISATACA